MYTILIVVGLALTSQTGGADQRYPPPGVAGQPAATTPSGNAAATGGAGNTVQPLQPLQPLNGGSRSPATSPGGGMYNRAPASGFSGQRTPSVNSGGSPSGSASHSPQFGNPGQAPPVTKSNEPPAAPQPPSPTVELMQAIMSPPSGTQLRGEPVRLVDVIGSGRTRYDQTQRVEAYWDLSSSVADYYLGLREQEELRKLGTGSPGAGWQEMATELGVRIGTSLRAARASQLRLANLVGRGPNNLPLPADILHCGSYASHYEQVFVGRASPEAQELAAVLPARFAELKDAGVAVARAEQWLDGVASQNGNLDAASNLRAWELLALRRRAFVQIARDYNRRIARYSELAAPWPISAEKLTSILIKRPTSPTATRTMSPAAQPSRQSSGADTSPPPTFVNNGMPPASASSSNAAGSPAKRDEAVQPASGAQPVRGQDRSLLVPPK